MLGTFTQGSKWETCSGHRVTTWSFKSNTQSRNILFLPKDKENPWPQEFTAYTQHFNSTRLSSTGNSHLRQRNPKTGGPCLRPLPCPSLPLSPQPHFRPPPPAWGPLFPSSPSSDPHFASCLPACLFLLSLCSQSSDLGFCVQERATIPREAQNLPFLALQAGTSMTSRGKSVAGTLTGSRQQSSVSDTGIELPAFHQFVKAIMNRERRPCTDVCVAKPKFSISKSELWASEDAQILNEYISSDSRK